MTEATGIANDNEVAAHIGTAISELYSAQEPEISNRATSLVAYLHINGVFSRWAPTMTHRVGWSYDRTEEVSQVMISELLHHLTERTDRLYKATVEKSNPAAGLYQLLSSLVYQYSRSAAEAATPGAAAVGRRKDRFNSFSKRATRELNRQPTVKEVVDLANRDAYDRYKDPSKNGIILDGMNHRVDSNQSLVEELHTGSEDTSISPEVMGAFADGVRQIGTTLMILHPDRPELVATLRAWFRGIEQGQIAPGREEHIDLAAATSLPPETAKEHLRLIHAARDEFAARARRNAA